MLVYFLPIRSPLRDDPLDVEAISDAIGNGTAKTARDRFARLLVQDLDLVFCQTEVRYPDKKYVTTVLKEVETLENHLNQANRLAQKLSNRTDPDNGNPFLLRLVRVVARLASTSRDKYVDFLAIEKFLSAFKADLQHVRFYNQKKGADTRLKLEVALTTARVYQRVFDKIPGIGGKTEIESRHGAAIALTPFQRVLDVIFRTKGIAIGKDSQRKAIDLLKKGNPSMPYYRPNAKK